MFRCPYCGENAFSLRLKLGINTKFGKNPICPECKKVVFRSVGIMGGRYLYTILLTLLGLLCVCGMYISLKMDFSMGTLLSIGVLTAAYLFYNYYLCYFDRGIMIDSKKRTMCVQLKEVAKIWPDIRKGEIYELLPANTQGSHYEDMYTIGMVEKIEKGKIYFRIIKNHSREGYAIKDNLIILCKETQYLAFVV